MKKREKLALIHQFYPNAVTTIDAVNIFIQYLEDVLDVDPSLIMMADSICSDDVNSIQYPKSAGEFLGPFKMGGLDGFPFAGLTGMGAFASHVPENGAIFIYYGPHIGVTQKSTIGEVNRIGQTEPSSCCGAAKGALGKLKDGAIVAGDVQEIDYQMNTIEQLLLKQKERVLKAEIPIQEATDVIYEAIDERMLELVAKTKFNCQYVVLMGGILINGDAGLGSFTANKRFDVINVKTNERQNLLNEYFPNLASVVV